MATAIESLSGTTIPPTNLIFDDRQASWIVTAGVVYRNGMKTVSQAVTLLLYYNHVVYQKNSANNWWKWNNAITVGNSWVATPNPTPAPTPIPSPTPAPTPPPALPVGETRIDFWQGGVLVNSTKIVPNGS